MTMGSIFGEAIQSYEPQQEDPYANTGEVPYAPPTYGPPAPQAPNWWETPQAQQEFGAGANAGEVPYAQPNYTATYGPPVPAPSPAEQIASNIGGGALSDIGRFALNTFMQGNVGGASPIGYGLAPGAPPSYGGTTYEQLSQVPIPYAPQVQGYVGDIASTAAQYAPGASYASYGLEQAGLPTVPDIARTAAESFIPTDFGQAALMTALATTAPNAWQGFLGFDPFARPAQEPAQVYRLGVPEEALANLPPENTLLNSRGAMQVLDPGAARVLRPGEALAPGEREMFFGGTLNGPVRPGLNVTPNPEDAAIFARLSDLERGLPPRPDLGQGPQMLGGELPAPGGRLYPPAEEPFRGGTVATRLPAEGMPGGIVDPDAFRISQVWAENMPNRPLSELSDTEVRTALYNSGLESAGRMPDVRARYEAADAAGVKLPLEQPPSGMPDALDLQRRSMPWEQPRPEEVAARNLPEPIRPTEPMETASQRISRLINEARPPETVPEVATWTTEQQIAEAKRLGLPDISGDLTRGTALTRQQATDLLQARVDLDQAIRFGSSMDTATENVMRQNRELGFSSQVAGRDLTPAQRDFLESQAGIDAQAQRAGGRGGRGGEMPPGAGGGSQIPRGGSIRGEPSLPAKLYNGIMELLYAPFGGDLSAPLRQLDVRTLNPLRAGETIQSTRVTAEAVRSQEAALRIFDNQRQRIEDLGVRMNLSTWNGKIVDREAMTSKVLNAVPGYEALNRGYSTAINERRVLGLEDFAAHHPNATPAQLQTYANYMERVTGRGSFGQLDQAASRLGPLFTSLRFAASWPERVSYTLPWTRLADGSVEIAGPIWREAVKDHAGFIVTGLSTLALAQQAGLKVDWDRGEIIAGNQHINLWGGGSQYVRAVLDVLSGEKNGKPYPAFLERTDDGTFKGTIAEFIRNKAGPLPEAVAAGVKATGAAKALNIENEIKFLRPDYWDKGVTGKDLGWADRVGQYIVPLWVQDVAKAMAEEGGLTAAGAKAGAVAGPVSFLGGGINSYFTNPRTAATNEIMSNPQNLANLPPNVAAFLQDKSWNAATPKEQRTILANLSPEDRTAVQKAEQELRDRKDVFQLNRDEAQQRADLAAQQREALKPIADRLLEDWKSGKVAPDKAVEAIKRVESRADKEANFTANVGPKLSESAAYQEAIKGFGGEKNAGRQEVDRIRDIANKYYGVVDDPRVKNPDGTINWDRVDAAQKAVMDTLRRADPGFATRVEFNLQKNPENDYELTKWISKIDDRLSQAGYYAVPTGGKTQFQREHPEVDALVSAKYGGPVHSQAAGDVLHRLLPERQVTYAR